MEVLLVGSNLTLESAIRLVPDRVLVPLEACRSLGVYLDLLLLLNFQLLAAARNAY